MKKNKEGDNRKVLRECDSNKRREHVSLPGKRFYPSNDGFCLLNVGITDFFCVKNNNAEMETKNVMVMVMQTGHGQILEMLRVSSFDRKKHWQNWINIWQENAISVRG